MGDPFLQDRVRRQADGVFDPLAFEILVKVRIGKGRVGAKIKAQDLAPIADNDRLQHTLPAVGAMHIAGTQSAAFQIAELVEYEERMIAGAFVMAIPDAHLLFAVRRADARVHVEHDAARRTASVNQIDPYLREQLGCRRDL